MELLRDPEADPAEAKGIGEHLETAYPHRNAETIQAKKLKDSK